MIFNSQETHSSKLKTTQNNTLANLKQAPLTISSGSVKIKLFSSLFLSQCNEKGLCLQNPKSHSSYIMKSQRAVRAKHATFIWCVWVMPLFSILKDVTPPCIYWCMILLEEAFALQFTKEMAFLFPNSSHFFDFNALKS